MVSAVLQHPRTLAALLAARTGGRLQLEVELKLCMTAIHSPVAGSCLVVDKHHLADQAVAGGESKVIPQVLVP